MSIVELTQDNLQEYVNGDKTVLIDFWAPWCGPCKQFGPVFEAAAEKHTDVVFAKVNVDDEKDLAAALRIRSIPTLMIYRENVMLLNQAGALTAPQLEEVIEKAKAVDMAKVHEEIKQTQHSQTAEMDKEK